MSEARLGLCRFMSASVYTTYLRYVLRLCFRGVASPLPIRRTLGSRGCPRLILGSVGSCQRGSIPRIYGTYCCSALEVSLSGRLCKCTVNGVADNETIPTYSSASPSSSLFSHSSESTSSHCPSIFFIIIGYPHISSNFHVGSTGR